MQDDSPFGPHGTSHCEYPPQGCVLLAALDEEFCATAETAPPINKTANIVRAIIRVIRLIRKNPYFCS
jgi:hypothetical protein